MKKSLASGVGVAAALVMAFGSGTASAVDEYKGLTYEQAAESISRWGTAVIATREGSYLPTEKCVVMGNPKPSGGKVMLNLNCNDTSALRGHPGNSVVTPEGKKAKNYIRIAKSISEDFAEATAAGETTWCEKNFDKCQDVCKLAGTCSAEVLNFIGA